MSDQKPIANSGLSRREPGLVLVLVLALHGCGTKDMDHDGGPQSGFDAASVEDAIPRREAPSRYGNPSSYTVFGKRYFTAATSAGYQALGIASWYGRKFHGRRTSSGERYDMFAMTAAHKSLPLPSYVRVTNVGNGRSVVVKVNDRGPFHGDRIIDLSYAAAGKIGMLGNGTAKVEVSALPPFQYLRGAPVARSEKDPTTIAQSDSDISVSNNRGYYLQVGAFRNLDNAVRLQSRLNESLSRQVHIHSTQAAPSTHRVRVGPFAGAQDAEDTVSALADLGIRDTAEVQAIK